jgi:hypothetical protein
VGALAFPRLAYATKLCKTKGACRCRRCGSIVAFVLLLNQKRERKGKAPFSKHPVAALVIPQSLAAGRHISAPAARKMLVLVLVLVIFPLVVL